MSNDSNLNDQISPPPSRRPPPRSTTAPWAIPGRRASTSASRSLGIGIPGLSPTRSTARSFTLSSASASSSSPITNWGDPRSQQLPTFEPRVIRATSNGNTRNIVDPACLPSSSTSPTRTRRQSGAGPGGRAPSTSRAPNSSSSSSSSSTSTPHHLPAPPQTPFPRPAYLAHSALRHLLQTEAPPSLPQRSTPSAAAGSGELHAYLVRRRRRSTIVAATATAGRGRGRDSPPDFEDSDEDSSPPPSRSSNRPQPRTVSSSSGVARAAGKATIAGGEEAIEYGEVMKLPTRWSQEVRCPSLSVSGDGRELTFNAPSSTGDKEAAAARTDYPIPPACGIFYYEVEILSKGQKGHISIGFAAGDVKLSRLPGWEKNSWGYHGDDGFSFSAEKNGTPYGPKFGTGDVVGCGIDFSQNRAFYTKDGAFLGNVFDRVGSTTPVYPSVGLRHSGEAIRVNFGHEPFKFNIEDHVLQARNVTWAAIMNTPLRREFITNSPPPHGNGDTDIKPDISAMDVAAAAAMGSEGRGPINQLVLSYLSHHGYAKTARAFQAQCESRGGLVGGGSNLAGGDLGVVPLPVPAPTPSSSSLPPHEDVDMDMDLTPSSKKTPSTLPTTTMTTLSTLDGWGPGTHPNDIELRTRIVNSVIEGDIDTALNETARWHPKVLEREEGLMLFKLRCRKFVELILEAAELKKRMKREEALGEGKSGVVDGMDIDDGLEDGVNGFAGSSGSGSSAIPIKAKHKHSISHSDWTGAAAAQYESALSSAISYGQALQSDYKTDSRPEVRAIFNRTFGVVAYEDPLEAGGDVAEVAGQEARVALATELNQDILQSQGRPAHPTLERLYRQTAACIVQLGLLGVGAAAFADMPKEFLDVDA